MNEAVLILVVVAFNTGMRTEQVPVATMAKCEVAANAARREWQIGSGLGGKTISVSAFCVPIQK